MSDPVPPPRPQRRKLLLWSLLLVLLLTLPYLVAWLSAPGGMVFIGPLFNLDDMNVYVSAMRQGAQGNWLYHFPYSPEPWQPRLMLLLYLLLGKVTALVATPTVFWLHFWRVVLSFVTIWALHVWLRALFPQQRQWRRTGFVLLLFGNGVGWLAIHFITTESRLFPDLGLPEWGPLSALLNTPHFALGYGLLTLTFLCLLRVERSATPRETLRWTALAILVANLSGLVYVYHLAVMGLVAGLFFLWLLVRRRSWRSALPPLLVALSLAPLLAYYVWGGGDDPYWLRYTQQDHVIPPPPPAGVLIGFGLLGPLALAGARWWRRQGLTALVPIWALAQLATLYVPGIGYSRRFVLGMFVPVATMATAGLEGVMVPRLARLNRPAFSIAAWRWLTIFLLLPSTVIVYLALLKGPQIQRGLPYYLPEADVQAARWLGEVAGESTLTMVYFPLGNYLPAVYPGKVFMGQPDFTTDLEGKLRLFERFWSGALSPAQQRAFLDEWQIDYLFVGTYEAPHLKAAPPPNAEPVYDEGGVAIYAVR